MIQDIFPHKLYNQFDTDAIIADEDRVIVFEAAEVVVKATEELDYPKYKELDGEWREDCFTYLFSVDGERYFGCVNAEEISAYLIGKPGNTRKSFNVIRGEGYLPEYRVYALYTAKHLLDWYRDNRYCGRCGGEMHHSDKERCMVCDCGYHAYPRIMPAVIVGVKNKDKLLLTRYRTGYKHNALIAGFVEIGETVEETVAREVMEEAGIKVKNITYYKSQPWGSANDLLLGYYCEVDGDDAIKMDEGELRYAAWVKREEIELQPDSLSLTNEMMKKFKEGKE